MPSSTRRLIPDMTKPNWTTKYSWAQNVVIMIILASFYSTVLWILVRRVWFYIKMFICCLLHNIGSIAMRKKSPIIWTATKFQQYSGDYVISETTMIEYPRKVIFMLLTSFFFLIWLWLENWPETLCMTQTVLSSTADAVSNQVLSPCSWNSLSTVILLVLLWLPSHELTSDHHKQLILFDYVPTNFSFLSLSKWGSFHDFIHLERETAYIY